MIVDRLDYAEQYKGLHPLMEKAFAVLREQPLSEMAPGRYEIDGENLFLLVQEYPTRSENDSFWESHRRYIDVQYMVKGTERFKYGCVNSLAEKEKYSEERDLLVWEGQGSDVIVDEGSFIIFFPQDAHMPCLLHEQSKVIKKAVLKIKV